jgi:high-affinity Fe2+/Pb2+ permease
MCENHRALLSKVRIEDNGTTHVYYSFSPTRVKFWMGFAASFLVLAGMLFAMKEGASKAVEDFVASKCGEYLAEFHKEVRPKLDADRKVDIDRAIFEHALATGAEYTAAYHMIEKQQTEAISSIRVEVAAHGATLEQLQRSEAHQTRMLEELIRRIE